MQPYSCNAKGTSIRRDRQGYTIKHVESTESNLPRREDDMSVRSFDEEDMYPANYNDEAANDSPDPDSNGELQLPLKESVVHRRSLHLHLRISDI